MNGIIFSQALNFEQLNDAAFFSLSKDKKLIKEQIDNSLRYIKSKSTLIKTRNLLFSIWCKAENNEQQALQEQVMVFLKEIDEKWLEIPLNIQWGMLILRSNVFASAAKFIGLRARLDSEFSRNKLRSYLEGIYGEVEQISRSLSSVLVTMENFGVIEKCRRGVYSIKTKREIKVDNSSYISWMLSILMSRTNRDSAHLQDLIDDSVWFPFCINVNINDVDENMFEILYQNNGAVLFKVKEY